MRTRRSTAALTASAAVTVAVALAASACFCSADGDGDRIAADDSSSRGVCAGACLLNELAIDLPDAQVATTAAAQPPVSLLQSVPRLPRQQVLILVGPQYGLPMVEAITPVMVRELKERGFSLDDVFVEFLDLHRVPGEEHAHNVLTLLQHKLEGRDIGLIIAVNQGAVDFIAREGEGLFPDAPLVIPIREQDPVWAGTPRQVMVLSSRQDVDGTLQYALALFPATQRVVIIMGEDDREVPFLAPIGEALEALPRELEVEDTSALSYEEMLSHIATLPPDTIALYGSYFHDVTGRSFVPAEVAATIADTVNAPVFAFRDMHIVQGLMGGSVVMTAELGRQAVAIGVQYLDGEIELAEQTTVFEIPNAPLFDYEVIQRFGGDHGTLPADTVFLNLPPSIWEEHRVAVLSAVIVFLVLVILIVTLFVLDRRLRKTLRERTLAQQSLMQSEEWYRSLFAQSVAPMSLFSPEGSVLEANDAWLDLFGYSREDLETLHATQVYCQPEQRAHFIAEVTARGYIADEEIQLKKKDGTIIDVVRSVTLRRGSDGTIIGYHNVLRDVSESKVSERALRASELKYRSLFEQSADAIVLVTPDGMGMEANQAWLDLFGYTREEFRHVNARDIYADPVDRSRFLRRIAETGYVKDVVRFKRKDGTVFDCQRSVAALKDDAGVTTAFLNVKRDITEELQRERALEESEERFRSVFEQSLDAICINSYDGLVIDANRTWADLLGYTMQEVWHLHARDVYADPSDRSEFLARIERDGSISDVVRLKKKDGSIIDCERSVVARRGEDGVIVAFQGIYHDITGRKRAEASLLESFARLERALQGTIDVIQRVVETRDPYTAGHQKRVAELAVAIARHMGLPEESCVSPIGTAALIHDIGKIAVPAEILSKPGELSEIELTLIRTHPQVGYDILKQAQLQEPLPEIVLQHHERLDGTGYPSGLRGDDILPEASILAVADVVEAMCSHRPYRAALGIDAALGEIRDGSSTRYYPDVVDACIAVFRDKGFTFPA